MRDSQLLNCSQDVTTPDSGCTTGCTNLPENERGLAVGVAVASVADGSLLKTSQPTPSKAESFSAGLMLIASLPLSGAEKAEAVRRLMGERDGSQG